MTTIEEAATSIYAELEAQARKGKLSKSELDAAGRALRTYIDHCTKTSKQAAKLSECSVESHQRAIRNCQDLGLWPGPAGHIFIIPRKQEAIAQVGYKGMIELILRQGRAVAIESVLVYREEPFKLVRTERGTVFRHEVRLDRKTDDLQGVIAIATLANGSQIFEPMSLREIEEVRRQHGSADGPWNTHFLQMARKPPITRLIKWLGTSDRLSRAMALMHALDGSTAEPRNVTPARRPAANPKALVSRAASYVEVEEEHEARQTVEA